MSAIVAQRKDAKKHTPAKPGKHPHPVEPPVRGRPGERSAPAEHGRHGPPTPPQPPRPDWETR